MITYYYRTLRAKEIHEVPEFKKGAWIYVEKPSSEELDKLAEEFKLDRGLLGDATDPFEVPRGEVEEGHTYVYTRVPVTDHGDTTTAPFLVVIGDTFVLTIAREQFPFLKEIIQGKGDISTTQKTKLFLQIFFGISRSYSTSLTGINRKVRATRAHVRNVSNSEIAQFVAFETTLNDFLSALIPTDALLKNFLSGRYIKLYEEDEDLVEDLLLANGQLLEMARSNIKTIGNIRSAYSTLMTNELNKTIRMLTALTIILAVPTMLASFYGMNVHLPFSESPLAFAFVVGLSLISALLIFFVFAKNRWL